MSVHNFSLFRGNTRTPWGFRLQGGADIGQPLTVQKVFTGGPAEGQLHRADVLLKIGLADCSDLTHEHATHLIKKATNHLNLTISRPLDRGGISPGISNPTTPASPSFFGGGQGQTHPLSGIAAAPPAPAPAAPKMFSNYQPSGPRPSSLYQTQMAPSPSNAFAQSEFIAMKTRQDEKDAIEHQTYRTNPLVLPGAKARHDLPTGSYLRHSTNPSYHPSGLSQPAMNKLSDALMLSKPGADSHESKSQVQQSLLGKGAPSSSAQMRQSMSPAPDGIILSNKTKVVHRQYNTPINMYSTQSVGDALAGQGVHQNDKATAIRFNDITKSPTYKMLQEDSPNIIKKPYSPTPHKAVTNQTYSNPSSGPAAKSSPSWVPENVNPMGIRKDRIHQSRSFHLILQDPDHTSDL